MKIAPIFILFILFSLSCSKDKNKVTGIACDGSNLAYNTGISAIINASCNASNCHGSGSSHGSFTSYAGLKPFLTNGSFNNSVLNNQNMPKGADLTKSQLDKIKCWVDNGYPEN